MNQPKQTKTVPFDGFGNVIEMLKYADNNFREKILRGIASRDPELAKRLLEATNQAIRAETSSNLRPAVKRGY